MNPLTPTYLRGILGKKFGPGRRMLNVSSPASAIRLLCATVPGFEEYARNMLVKVVLRDGPVRATEIDRSTGHQEIRIVPVVRGAKSDGFSFVLGAVLTAASFIPGIAATPVGMYMRGIGISMMIGGVAQLLFAPPEQAQGTDSKNSYLFNSAENTVAQGNPVPVLHGQMIVNPPLVSAGIETEAFSTDVFSTDFDGLGNWTGNGNTAPWGASLDCA